MAFLFRACRRGEEERDVLPDGGGVDVMEGGDGVHDWPDNKPLPRSVGGYYYYEEGEVEEDGGGRCFLLRPCSRRAKNHARGRRGRSMARINPMVDINHLAQESELATVAALQQKRSLPARSPSRKLTPYPGKTQPSSLKNLARFVQTQAPGGLGAMDRNPSFRRSNAERYSLTNDSSKASSVCAESGAKPIRSGRREKDGKSGSSSEGQESSNSGAGTQDSGSGDSGNTGTSTNTRGSTCSYDSIDWSKPPSSLLEASMRRVAINERKEIVEREKERIRKLKLYPKPLKVFTESFFKGLLGGNSQWASDARVVDCFHEDARMMTHDGQMYYGRLGLIKRLNRGMERLLKMLGEHGKGKLPKNQKLDLAKLQEMGLECLEPVQTEEGTWRVVFNMKKGVLKYSFEDEFVMEEGTIRKLTRRMIK
mmetsp:Transcript_4995/g.17990  ORF Transcript_4995/g.17990 Transcript_4995/m.17990 type:complete len:424 (-) Transcript_4995:132-1403(-)